MTSVLPGEDSKIMKMKQKLMSDSSAKEEMRSFLNFSRENLNMSDLERGFNRSRLRPSRNTILSVAALTITLLCLGLEAWQLRCSIANTREIQQLKRDVEDLKHRFLEQDLIDEIKAFEEQLYSEESTEDDDPGAADIDNADYDSSYDDDESASHDYSGDYHIPSTYASRTPDLPEITSTSIPIPTYLSSNSSSDRDILELLTALRKIEMQRGKAFEKNVRENHKNIERERLEGERKVQLNREEKVSGDTNGTERDIFAKDAASTEHARSGFPKKKDNVKLKRSVNDRRITDYSTDVSNYQRNRRRHIKRTIMSRAHSHASDESEINDNVETNTTTSTISRDKHPPKKYYTHARPEASSMVHDDQLSEEIIRPNRGRTGGGRKSEGDEGTNWRGAHLGAHRGARNRTENRGQVYAIHYGADSTLFSAEDEHTGNGRARHNNGVFKAWRPSDWVAELGMSRHFTLATDGKLTVHEPGLYLVYAQIHYLDEHDENGFHVLVNGRPIMQCMVYSPGAGHKSRSCFSAQVTVLRASDYLVLKDVGSARYTLFQHDKSFFGLTKLGEPRQQHRHQS